MYFVDARVVKANGQHLLYQYLPLATDGIVQKAIALSEIASEQNVYKKQLKSTFTSKTSKPVSPEISAIPADATAADAFFDAAIGLIDTTTGAHPGARNESPSENKRSLPPIEGKWESTNSIVAGISSVAPPRSAHEIRSR